jgi:hypothetical protein
MTCLVWWIAAGCGTSTPTYQLRYKYAPGSTLSYQQISKGSIISREGDSVATDRVNTVTSNITFTVRRVVDDTTWEIQQKMVSSYQSLNRVDSTVTDTTETSPEMTIYIASNGRIVDFEYSSASPGKDNTAYMKEYFRQGTPVFPDRPVQVGYAWTQTYDVTVDNAPVQVATNYTIKGVEKRQGYECIAVGYSGRMVIPFQASPSDTLKRHGTDRLTNEGVMYHAVKEGITISQTERWTLSGDREKLRNGTEIPYVVRADYEVSYDLKAVSKP